MGRSFKSTKKRARATIWEMEGVDQGFCLFYQSHWLLPKSKSAGQPCGLSESKQARMEESFANMNYLMKQLDREEEKFIF